MPAILRLLVHYLNHSAMLPAQLWTLTRFKTQLPAQFKISTIDQITFFIILIVSNWALRWPKGQSGYLSPHDLNEGHDLLLLQPYFFVFFLFLFFSDAQYWHIQNVKLQSVSSKLSSDQTKTKFNIKQIHYKN
jgi:hypothetical protein